MKQLGRNILLIFLALVIIAAIFALGEGQMQPPQEVTLNELVRLIEAEKVKSIEISADRLTVNMDDGSIKRSVKEKEESLLTTLINLGVTKEQLRSVDIVPKTEGGLKLFLGAVLPILLPFALIAFLLWYLMKSAQRGQMSVFNFGQSKARLYNKGMDKKKVGFDDVGGLDETKEELKEVVEFLKDPQKFRKIGARIPKGVLLVGSPGTGKTLIARAVANEAGVPFFYISGSDFVEMFVGVGASRVRSTFEMAKKNAPAILFIDELDAIGRQRGAGLGGGHDEREQTLNQILVEMDGFDKNVQVIVMSATNRPDVLDPALLRPGRFDRRIILDEPDLKARQQILIVHARGKPLASSVNLKKIAERTPGFSGADLENVLNEAAILAARKNRYKITQTDFYEAIEKVLLGPERKSRLLSKKEKRIAAYHEAGHAVVAYFTPDANPVQKVSIIARGRAGGYTLSLPTEEKYFRTREEFRADLAVALGGYAAERLIFGEITTGASNDLQHVSDIARRIVTKYGMSERIGPISLGRTQELVFLGREIHEERNYSERTAALIDSEISRVIKKSLQQARAILMKHKDSLERVAGELVKRETLEKEAFEKLVKQDRAKSPVPKRTSPAAKTAAGAKGISAKGKPL